MALAELIEANKERLLDNWAARVRRDPAVPSAVPLSTLALHDHFPALLDRIVATLRTCPPADDGAVEDGAEALGATVGDAAEAHDHVRDRVQAHYEVPEVLRELSHLRIAILDACEASGVELDGESTTLLHAAFDHLMIHAADELARLALTARRRAEALAAERAELYEKEKRGREALEDAHRAKDQFLAVISHELRTPLHAISGWSQMLAQNEDDPAVRARAVASIRRNAQAQGHLIDSVLDITRLTGGRVTMAREPIDLAQLLRNTVDSFTPMLEEKKLTLKAVLPEIAPVVLGDEQRVRQVFTNLLGNATKFTPAGGTVRVSLESNGSTVRAEVSDTGSGIEPSFLPHVFEPFRQEDPGWARAQGGLGLGLAITKALVELHGGTIEVRSEGHGQGTTVSVTLPVAAPASSQTELPVAPAVSGPRLAGLHVLVVDDAPDARDVVGAMLESAGAQVELASSGAEALEGARRVRPDVLVSDLAMPGMHGLDFLRRFRAELGEIPAIAVSAFTTPRAVADSKAAGFHAHLAKPVVMNELLEAVAALASTPGAGAELEARDGRDAKATPNRSVLVVEDDRAIAEELAELLEERGFTVTLAHDGAKAWSLLHETDCNPSVILLDMMLPVMDGWTLRRKLLGEERLASIPVVVVTGTPAQDLGEVERVDAVLRKPFDVRSLLSALGPAGERRKPQAADAR
ncbi:MAG TPA: response regulator [Polyangiaceae bacterium]